LYRFHYLPLITNKTGGITFEVELPVLKKKTMGNLLRIGKPVEISVLRFFLMWLERSKEKKSLSFIRMGRRKRRRCLGPISPIVLGGNQNDQVCYSKFKTNQIVAYVIPTGFEGVIYELPEIKGNINSASYAQTR